MRTVPQKNTKLKAFLFKAGTTQRKLSQLSGIHENYISLIINGRYVPTEKEQEKLATTLNCFVNEIFEE